MASDDGSRGLAPDRHGATRTRTGRVPCRPQAWKNRRCTLSEGERHDRDRDRPALAPAGQLGSRARRDHRHRPPRRGHHPRRPRRHLHPHRSQPGVGPLGPLVLRRRHGAWRAPVGRQGRVVPQPVRADAQHHRPRRRRPHGSRWATCRGARPTPRCTSTTARSSASKKATGPGASTTSSTPSACRTGTARSPRR